MVKNQAGEKINVWLLSAEDWWVFGGKGAVKKVISNFPLIFCLLDIDLLCIQFGLDKICKVF